MTPKPPYKSHQEVADELNLRMDDPFTRVAVAALYWCALAQYWKELAKGKT